MIDLNDLRANPAKYIDACAKKRVNFDVNAFLKLDESYRGHLAEVESLRSKQNSFSKEIPKLSGPAKDEGLKTMKEIAAKLKESGDKLKLIEEEWKAGQYRLPGVPLAKVPEGKDDSENKEIKKVGAVPNFDFKIKDHVELGSSLNLLDVERGVKIAGARNYFLKGDGMRLQHGVLSLALDLLHKKNYTLMDPPHLVKYEAMLGTGYFPGGEDQAYRLDERDTDTYLIGTSEVSVCSYHMEEILNENELPKRYAGYSPCYRREAGTYGKDAQGIYRIHQFYKVEQVIICKNDTAESEKLHAEILGNAEELMGLLELPYRVVDVCTGDMGLGQAYKNDIETWMPSREKYSETHSCSTFYEFQSRRLNIRYKNQTGKNLFCHTLNNTLIASPRILIPLLEIHQTKDGQVKIPAALRPYMGGQEYIK
jgi:seryl-tRNA synthetase